MPKNDVRMEMNRPRRNIWKTDEEVKELNDSEEVRVTKLPSKQ